MNTPEMPRDFDRLMPFLATVLLRGNQPKAKDWNPDEQTAKEFAWLRDPAAIRRASYYTALQRLIMQCNISPPENPDRLSVQPFHPFAPRDIPDKIRELGFDEETQRELLAGGVSVTIPRLLSAYTPMGHMDNIIAHMRKEGFTGENCLIDPLTGFLMWRAGDRMRNCSLTHASTVLRAHEISPAIGARFRDNPNLELCQGVDIAHEAFRRVLGPGEMAKLAQNEVPEIQIHTHRDLATLMAALQQAIAEIPGGQLWLRGQAQDHLLPDRQALVRKWITPWSDIRDSSLRPNLYRRLNNHLDSLEDWEALVRELSYWSGDADLTLPAQWTYHDVDTGKEISAPQLGPDTQVRMEIFARGHAHERAPLLRDIGLSTRWVAKDKQGQVIARFEKRHHHALSAYMRGLLMQHYGAPTAWLDITRDTTTALWFALRKMTPGPDGVVVTRHRWDGLDPAKWPTIYVFPLLLGLSEFLDSETILQGTNAVRPVRQHCGLLGGAGILAQNYPSRYVGLKIRLSPAFIPPDLPGAMDLFPAPADDPVLNELIECEQKLPTPRRYPIYQVAKEDLT